MTAVLFGKSNEVAGAGFSLELSATTKPVSPISIHVITLTLARP
jgi:hypothetical protein